MTHVRLTLIAVAFACAAGGLISGANALRRQHGAEADLRRRASQLSQKISTAQRDRENVERDLEAAERQLAELKRLTSPTARPGDAARESEIKAWIARTKLLKQFFERRSDQRIPEMHRLTDDDWLRLSRRSLLDTEENIRDALAAVRTDAKAKFSTAVMAARGKYVQAGNTVPPAVASVLAPYFEDPTDAAALSRYEIVTPSSSANRASASPTWALREKAPVDADYDSRIEVTANGWGSSNAPLAWIPNFREKVQQASTAYGAANNGALAYGFSSLLPYFNPPLDPNTVERVLKAEQRRSR